jgi:hypothetical protein
MESLLSNAEDTLEQLGKNTQFGAASSEITKMVLIHTNHL